MAWLSLIAAGLFETAGVMTINRLNKERNVQSLLLLLGAFGASFILLAYAMEFLPMSTAYAIWTGIGASGGALAGMFLYGESRDWRRVLCILIILGAAVGLKLVE
ncbi:Multidrug resistance protein ykkD [Bhargavaea cecembensis DSE10]|uniref:Multidrug resistance protein ykkD n=1 Tax=Bhargavaea cecembensis DSE10 TaxID=1235279 RepID=M7NFU3_9BACL|nr:multidrug efflux SMR transporter [Bhargavaea cecembensis]EMR06117.1 Multidrug resistance protein ykkD [Bhargavaea cecembensis DSE10]